MTPSVVSGERLGDLVAVKKTERRGRNGEAFWAFMCDCGELVERNAPATKARAKRGVSPCCTSCKGDRRRSKRK